MKAGDYFSDYFLKSYELHPDEELKVEYVDPSIFLTKERFDLIFKLFYIKCFIENKDCELAKQLYSEHIKCFTNEKFVELGNDNKKSIDDYISVFENLIFDIRDNGFDVNKSVIPVGPHGIISNGSHRVAICIFFNIKIAIVRVKVDYCFDYNFFRNRGMSDKYLSLASFMYPLLVNNAHVFVINFPNHKKTRKLSFFIEHGLNTVFTKTNVYDYIGGIELWFQLLSYKDASANYEKYKMIRSLIFSPFKRKRKITFFVVLENDTIINRIKNTLVNTFRINPLLFLVSNDPNEAVYFSKYYLMNTAFYAGHQYINSKSDFSIIYKLVDKYTQTLDTDAFTIYNTQDRIEYLVNEYERNAMIDYYNEVTNVFYFYGVPFLCDFNSLSSFEINSLVRLKTLFLGMIGWFRVILAKIINRICH